MSHTDEPTNRHLPIPLLAADVATPQTPLTATALIAMALHTGRPVSELLTL